MRLAARTRCVVWAQLQKRISARASATQFGMPPVLVLPSPAWPLAAASALDLVCTKDVAALSTLDAAVELLAVPAALQALQRTRLLHGLRNEPRWAQNVCRTAAPCARGCSRFASWEEEHGAAVLETNIHGRPARLSECSAAP